MAGRKQAVEANPVSLSPSGLSCFSLAFVLSQTSWSSIFDGNHSITSLVREWDLNRGMHPQNPLKTMSPPDAANSVAPLIVLVCELPHSCVGMDMRTFTLLILNPSTVSRVSRKCHPLTQPFIATTLPVSHWQAQNIFDVLRQ